MARRQARGVQGVPSAFLLRLNRQALANIVVEGGSEPDRVEAVRAVHASSRVQRAPFCAVDSTRDLETLMRALQCWLGHGVGASPIHCPGGTLYVEDPGALPPLAQRLLVALAERLELQMEPRSDGEAPTRLAAGSAGPLEEDVIHGRLHAGLHDALDKFRLRLGTKSTRSREVG